MKAFRIIAVAVVVLAIAAWAASGYLLSAEPVPETSSYELDLAEVRRLASSSGKASPIRIHEELIAEAELPRGAIFGGESFEAHPMVHRSFQVYWEDRWLVIDAGMGPEMVDGMGGGTFYPEAYERMQRALSGAESIVFTHEHQDHIDGAARGDVEALAGRILFNKPQRANVTALEAVDMPEALIASSRAFAGGRYVAVAPGVVLIEAAGHTPGSQMVYVVLRNGREFLFLGDVAWHQRQIDELIYRPRLVTDFVLGEDRAKVLGQFRTLHELLQKEKIRFVVSHDANQRLALLADGSIGPQFEF